MMQVVDKRSGETSSIFLKPYGSWSRPKQDTQITMVGGDQDPDGCRERQLNQGRAQESDMTQRLKATLQYAYDVVISVDSTVEISLVN